MNAHNDSRRRFLKSGAFAGGGLIVAMHIPGLSPLSAAIAAEAADGVFRPNAFVQLTSDGNVTVYVGQAEMGQGVLTSLPMLVADEMDADLDRVKVEMVGADAKFNHPLFGAQITGGSNSVRGFFDPMRRAGAEARYQLMEAASQRLEAPRSALRTEAGFVIHEASGRRISYGELANAAANLPAPDPGQIVLKTPDQFRYIGRGRKRFEGPDKVTGKAKYGLDVNLPGMLTAVVVRPPVFGATMISFKSEAALAVAGVRKVKAVPGGVAVIADHFWAAKKGRDALEVEWDLGANASVSSDVQRDQYADLASKSGAVALKRGDAEAKLANTKDALEVDIHVPYLAHATMEPLNATVHHQGDKAEVWTGTQMPGPDRDRAAAILGLPTEKVVLHNLLLGGGFGRRANPAADFVALATTVAKDETMPIKTVWTREDDTRGGWFRPRAFHRIRVETDKDGLPLAWHHRVVAQSIFEGTAFEAFGLKNGVDESVVEGVVDLPYSIENLLVECKIAPRVVPVLWFRSVGHTHTALAVEHTIDQLARRAKRDPLEFRRALLKGNAQWLRALDMVAEESGWETPLADGRARGLAIHASFGSVVAQVAEVSVENNRPRVHRVVAVADLGTVVNPRHAKAQIEGGIVFGLSAALHQRIDFKDGQVQQSNFHDYPMLRQDEMPTIEVHLVDSKQVPGGAGEPGVPPIAPAVANALLALTGRATSELPFKLA